MSEKIEREGISPVNYVGIALLLVCYFGALWNVLKNTGEEKFGGRTIVRLCHWQLETGVRSGVEEMIRRFEAENPGVKIEQIPISERAYAQWVTTQLIGRTAPDIIEVGMFDTRTYLGRYFQPITDIIDKPNPYNKDNQFRDVPWKDTFLDGMQSSYISELVEYYTVPLSQFTIRIFYNKDLFEEVLGNSNPPSSLKELFDVCEKIVKYVEAADKAAEIRASKEGQLPEKLNLNPISASSYQVNLFKTRYACALSSDRVLALDRDFDGETHDFETLTSFLSGELTFDDPKYKASREIVKDIAKYFPRGFMSVDRMDAGFAFVQGRATMITSGSWDANSFVKQIKEQPFGDVIKEVDGKAVSNSKEAEDALLTSSVSKSVKLKILRDRHEKVLTIAPSPGPEGQSLLDAYGLKLKDCLDDSGNICPVVTFVQSSSPASRAGLRKRMRFDVGVFDFPMPRKDDPKYGEFFNGKVAEVVALGFPLGVTKFSKNQDIAIKFLQFCTTPENNQELNRISQWIPSVKGAEPFGLLTKFVPDYRGYWGYLNFNSGPRSTMKESQTYWPYISDEGAFGYDNYIKALKNSIPSESAYDYERLLNGYNESIPDKNLRRSSALAGYLFPDTAGTAQAEKNARKLAAAWDILAYTVVKPLLVRNFTEEHLKKDAEVEFLKQFRKTHDSFKKD